MSLRELQDRMLFVAMRRGLANPEDLASGYRRPHEVLRKLLKEERLSREQVLDLEAEARRELAELKDRTPDPAAFPEHTRMDLPPAAPTPAPPRPGDSGGLPALRDLAQRHSFTEGEPWGEYRLLEFLGEGGMGRVFKALDPVLGRPVALKILIRSEALHQARFYNEARAQARVDHPHVAKVYTVGQHENQLFIAMQYVEGGTLRELARSLDLEDRVRIMARVCSGVHAAHRMGVIHRDLKPGNVMLERDNYGKWQPVVMDFGLASVPEDGGLTREGQTVGTPQYMSPEQARCQPVDRRSDVYSLGVTLFELLCGRPPFQGENLLDVLRQTAEADPPRPTELAPQLPRDLETIILRALEKSPSHRYDSAKALAEDLQRFLDGEPIQARPQGRRDRLRHWVRRHRVLAVAAGASLATLLVVGGFSAAAVLRSRAQAQAAQRFSAEAERLETLLSKVYALPAHDVQRSEDEVRGAVARLEVEVGGLGRGSEGPGRLALGRAHLALGEVEEAHRELGRAWELGYRTPEVAYDLGLAKASLYRAAIQPLWGSSKEERARALEEGLRRPALELLRQAQGGGPLARGLLALTEDRDDEALSFARQAVAAQPWLYEADLLEAEVRMAQAQDAGDAGRFEEARARLEDAGQAVERARGIGRSAPAVYLMEARRRTEAVRLGVLGGSFQERDRDWALQACRDLRSVRSGSWQAWERMGAVELNWANQLGIWDRDERPALDAGILDVRHALERRPGASEALDTLGSLWWRRAQADEMQGGDPRASLKEAEAVMQQALAQPDMAEALHHRMGNCFTTQALYELRHGGDPKPSLQQAVEHYRASLLARPTAYTYSDLVWALGVRMQAEALAGEDPSADLAAARQAWAGAESLQPGHYFVDCNLAEALVFAAQHRLDLGQDPVPLLDESLRLSLRSLQQRPGFRVAMRVAGKALLLKARWEAAKGRDPRPELAAARAQVEACLALAPDSSEASALLLEVELEQLRLEAEPGPALRRVRTELQRLAQANPSNAELPYLESRVLLAEAEAAPAAQRPAREAEARAALERSLGINPNLRRRATSLLARLPSGSS